MTKKALILFYIFSILYSACYCQNEKQTQTLCTIYYNNFDYKNTGSYYLVAKGNLINSEREGLWVFTLPNGIILAEGKYKKGKKIGKWAYRNTNGFYKNCIWNKDDLIVDKIDFIENKYALIIDFSLKENMNIYKTSIYPFKSINTFHFR